MWFAYCIVGSAAALGCGEMIDLGHWPRACLLAFLAVYMLCLMVRTSGEPPPKGEM